MRKRQLIFRKIITIVAIMMPYFKAKMHQIRFWGSAQDTANGAYWAPPDPLAGFNRAYTSKGGE